MTIAIQTAGIVNKRITPVSANITQIQEHYQYDVTANSTITLLAIPTEGTEVVIITRNNITATVVVAGGGLINGKASEIITGNSLVECRFLNGVWTTSVVPVSIQFIETTNSNYTAQPNQFVTFTGNSESYLYFPNANTKREISVKKRNNSSMTISCVTQFGNTIDGMLSSDSAVISETNTTVTFVSDGLGKIFIK